MIRTPRAPEWSLLHVVSDTSMQNSGLPRKETGEVPESQIPHAELGPADSG